MLTEFCALSIVFCLIVGYYVTDFPGLCKDSQTSFTLASELISY